MGANFLRSILIWLTSIAMSLLIGNVVMAEDSSAKLLQIVGPGAFDWKEILNYAEIQFLKIDDDEVPVSQKLEKCPDLIKLVENASDLQSIWLPGRFLTNEFLSAAARSPKLRTLVVIDPVDEATALDKLRQSTSLKLVVLIRHKTKMSLVDLSGTVDSRGWVLKEVRLFENSPYLNSNGCPTSDFLTEHFGAKFGKSNPMSKQ